MTMKTLVKRNVKHVKNAWLKKIQTVMKHAVVIVLHATVSLFARNVMNQMTKNMKIHVYIVKTVILIIKRRKKTMKTVKRHAQHVTSAPRMKMQTVMMHAVVIVLLATVSLFARNVMRVAMTLIVLLVKTVILIMNRKMMTNGKGKVKMKMM